MSGKRFRPRPADRLVRLAARRLLFRLEERGAAFARPARGAETWKTSGPEWRAARRLVDSGKAVAFGTKRGWFAPPWSFREVILGLPSAAADLEARYPGCRVGKEASR